MLKYKSAADIFAESHKAEAAGATASGLSSKADRAPTLQVPARKTRSRRSGRPTIAARRQQPCSRLYLCSLARLGLPADFRQSCTRRDCFRVHFELDHSGALVGDCLLESRLELFGALDGRAKSTISARQSGKIRVLESGADDPAGEAPFLMHADRAVH